MGISFLISAFFIYVHFASSIWNKDLAYNLSNWNFFKKQRSAHRFNNPTPYQINFMCSEYDRSYYCLSIVKICTATGYRGSWCRISQVRWHCARRSIILNEIMATGEIELRTEAIQYRREMWRIVWPRAVHHIILRKFMLGTGHRFTSQPHGFIC